MCVFVPAKEIKIKHEVGEKLEVSDKYNLASSAVFCIRMELVSKTCERMRFCKMCNLLRSKVREIQNGSVSDRF
jgi:hypothetical protein